MARKRRHLRRVQITPKEFERLNHILEKANKADAVQKGRAHERLVESVVLELAYKGKIPTTTAGIRLTRPFSSEDKDGNDLLIETDQGRIGIQVKSSWKAYLDFRKIRPNLICVRVNKDTKRKTLAWLLQRLIWGKYKQMQMQRTLCH